MQLYLRALKGEPDPDAFSRRVAVLTKTVRGRGRAKENVRVTVTKAEHLIEEIYRRMISQSAVLADLFDRAPSWIRITAKSGTNDLKPPIKTIELPEDWEEVDSIVKFIELESEPSFTIQAAVAVVVGDSGASVKGRVIVNPSIFGGDIDPHEHEMLLPLNTEHYDDLVSAIVTQVLERMIRIIEDQVA